MKVGHNKVKSKHGTIWSIPARRDPPAVIIRFEIKGQKAWDKFDEYKEEISKLPGLILDNGHDKIEFDDTARFSSKGERPRIRIIGQENMRIYLTHLSKKKPHVLEALAQETMSATALDVLVATSKDDAAAERSAKRGKKDTTPDWRQKKRVPSSPSKGGGSFAARIADADRRREIEGDLSPDEAPDHKGRS